MKEKRVALSKTTTVNGTSQQLNYWYIAWRGLLVQCILGCRLYLTSSYSAWWYLRIWMGAVVMLLSYRKTSERLLPPRKCSPNQTGNSYSELGRKRNPEIFMVTAREKKTQILVCPVSHRFTSYACGKKAVPLKTLNIEETKIEKYSVLAGSWQVRKTGMRWTGWSAPCFYSMW